MCQALLWVLGPTHEGFHYGAYIGSVGVGWEGTMGGMVGCERGQTRILMRTFCARCSARHWGCMAISALMPVCWGVWGRLGCGQSGWPF